MAWLWVILVIIILLTLASFGRKQEQQAAVGRIRGHFPRLARMRLIAACPNLEGVLDEATLRMLFDWILMEMYRRTGATGLGELMRWSIDKGEAQAARITAEVTREAVDRLPQPVLAVLDECRGRTFAGVILDEALTEAGHRAAPDLKKRI